MPNSKCLTTLGLESIQSIMMPKLPLLLLSAAIVILAGCASTPTRVDTGPVRARTFSFVDRGPKPGPAYADNRESVHAMIQQAIVKNLASRGVTKTASGGDITASYLLIIGNNASTTTIDDYFGYGEDEAHLRDAAHTAYTQSKNPNFFEAGTLLIDLVDGKSFKVLKRNYATRPLLRELPPDARAERIQEVVDEILKDLRIVP